VSMFFFFWFFFCCCYLLTSSALGCDRAAVPLQLSCQNPPHPTRSASFRLSRQFFRAFKPELRGSPEGVRIGQFSGRSLLLPSQGNERPVWSGDGVEVVFGGGWGSVSTHFRCLAIKELYVPVWFFSSSLWMPPSSTLSLVSREVERVAVGFHSLPLPTHGSNVLRVRSRFPFHAYGRGAVIRILSLLLIYVA